MENKDTILDISGLKIDVFNAGFVRLVDCMPRVIPSGNEKLRCDFAIAEAARVSYGEGTKGYENDKRLIRYLLRNKHTSPFEMVKFKFHLKLPIFVQRQLIRHRTANVNEISGRYTKIEDEFYVPDTIRGQSADNKQGSSENFEVSDELRDIYNSYMDKNKETYNLYEQLIENGVAKELSRICLPQNIYTELYWCIDLHNLLHFLKLRNSAHAQFEIRMYAKALQEIVKQLCPVTIEAYTEFFEGSITLSTKELSLVRDYLNDASIIKGKFSTKREETEFIDKMKLI